MTFFESEISRVNENNPSVKIIIDKIKLNAISLWRSKLTSVAIKIEAITIQNNKAEIVVKAIAQCVHFALNLSNIISF